MPSTTTSSRRSIWQSVRDALAPSIRPSRLLLALKTAIAVGLAWPVAWLLPGTLDDYSYYAPLGALVSMMPTLVGSVRTSVQTVVAIGLGVLLAAAVIAAPLPLVVSVPVATGLGVLVGGIRGLGAGRDYVAIAALFVLVIGGSQADDFAAGFLVQMAVGMAIGFAVNFLVVPPLRFREAGEAVSGLRVAVADALDGMSEALVESWPPERAEWWDAAEALQSSVRAAEPVVGEAAESRRLNPRSRWVRHDVRRDWANLEAVSVLARHTRELSDALGSAMWGEPVSVGIPNAVRQPLSDALEAVADVVRAWNGEGAPADAADAASERINALVREERKLPSDPSESEAVTAVIFTLRRMLVVLRGRVE